MPEGRLQAAAEEGVGRAADPQPGGLGRVQQRLAALARSSASGFSFQTCLPAAIACRPPRRARPGCVRLTTISTPGCSSTVSTPPASGTPCSAALAAADLRVEVSDRQHLDVGEAVQVLQVGVADHAGADDADADRPACRSCQAAMSGRRR